MKLGCFPFSSFLSFKNKNPNLASLSKTQGAELWICLGCPLLWCRVLTHFFAIYQFGTFLMIGQLSNYMRTFGVDEKALGAISAIGSLAGTLALLGGVISKRIGLKWMVILNHLVSLPYPLLCAFGTTPAAFTAATIFSRLPYMFNFGITVYIFSYKCNSNKIRAMMMMSAITHIVAIFAPTVGGLLIERIGMQNVLILTALCYLICVVLCCFMTEEQRTAADGAEEMPEKAVAVAEEYKIKNFIRKKENLPILLLIGLFAARFLCDTSGPLDGVNMITLFYEDRLGMSTIFRSYASTAMSVGIVVFLLVSSRLTGKKRLPVILFLATLNVLSDLSLLTGSVWIAVIFAFFRGSRNSLMSLCSSLASDRMPDENRRVLMSFYAAAYHVMQFISTQIGSNLYYVHSYLPFAVEIGITIVGCAGLTIYQRKYGEI